MDADPANSSERTETKIVGDGPPSERLYIVSDGAGFVGAFLSHEEAIKLTRGRFPTSSFVIQVFPRPPGPATDVWLVIYRANDAVVYASTVRDDAARVQTAYERIGLVYENSLDELQHPIGKVCIPAEKRLELQHRVHLSYVAAESLEEIVKSRQDDLARVKSLSVNGGGPLAELISQNESTTYMSFIVDKIPEADRPGHPENEDSRSS